MTNRRFLFLLSSARSDGNTQSMARAAAADAHAAHGAAHSAYGGAPRLARARSGTPRPCAVVTVADDCSPAPADYVCRELLRFCGLAGVLDMPVHNDLLLGLADLQASRIHRPS